MSDDFTPQYPVPVRLEGFDLGSLRPRSRTNTSYKTYVIDPASAPAWVQIATFEPNRDYMLVIPIDAPVAICQDPPSKSPDTSSASVAPTGAHLPVSSVGYMFYGTDAAWLNSLNTLTRVTVIKVYCHG